MGATTRATTKQGNAVRRRIERRCRQLGERRASSYRRVILALYMASGAEGLWCCATNRAIGVLAGVSECGVGAYLRMAEADGLVTIFRPGPDRVRCRVMIFSDHPKGAAEIRKIAAYAGC